MSKDMICMGGKLGLESGFAFKFTFHFTNTVCFNKSVTSLILFHCKTDDIKGCVEERVSHCQEEGKRVRHGQEKALQG